MVIRRAIILKSCLALVLFAAAPAVGQQADGVTRFSGTIEKLDGQRFTLKSADSSLVDFNVTTETMITSNVPSSLDAIKAGDYIASAAIKGEDGKLHSTELRIFPEGMRGLGEGQRAMQEPGKTMTNASVSEVVAAADGPTLKVTFKGGTSELVVGPKVPIIAVVIGKVDDLKVGQSVFVMAGNKAADGSLDAKRIFAR
jgi:hypothetical protein